MNLGFLNVIGVLNIFPMASKSSKKSTVKSPTVKAVSKTSKSAIRIIGSYEKLGTNSHFIPDSLPPKNPNLQFDEEMIVLYGEAMRALGQLNEMAKRLPDVERFVKAYVIKEALLSSEIEGINTTMIDVLSGGLDGQKPSKETQLVLNYSKALDAAISMVVDDKMPIVSRVILATHKILMSAENSHASPGQYRKQSVRVGNLIPPIATKVPNLISDLEKFINSNESLPALIRTALTHVQFETIHPFLDGNGRIGRLLIVLMLIADKLLISPIIYPSFFFKKNHFEYYLKLDKVRVEGDFESWVKFFLKSIIESAYDAHKRAKKIENLEQKILKKISLSKESSSAQEQQKEVLIILFKIPVISVGALQGQVNKTYNTAEKIIRKLVKQKILKEITKNKRNKIYVFENYLEILQS